MSECETEPSAGSVKPPTKPDAVYAKKLQELVGGSFGEMTVMMQYLFQGWNCRFIIASGNLLADFRSNLHAESQGLRQAVRLYEMTDDPGVKDHLSFMIARDTMHQNQWLAAIEDLQIEGFEEMVVPKIAYEYGKKEHAYQFLNHSEGEESAQGRWAKGTAPDGKGEFEKDKKLIATHYGKSVRAERDEA